MNIFLKKTRAFLHRLTKQFGNSSLRRYVWNREFSSGQWDYLEHTSDDVVYHYLRKYANDGGILDLGCGSGNTGNEIDIDAYGYYLGIDISGEAVAKATHKSTDNQRGVKNEYLCADVLRYVPDRKYDVILFRESIFYISESKIPGVLRRYSEYLVHGGVFIVRMWNREKYKGIVGAIERHFNVVEKHLETSAQDVVLVFRSSGAGRREVGSR